VVLIPLTVVRIRVKVI